MSIVIKFFVAPDHAAAAAVVERGPDRVFNTLTYGNFDIDEALIEWESILTGRSFDELVAADESEVVADPDGGPGPLLIAASRSLQDALAGADEPWIVEVSQQWIQKRAEDGEEFDQELAAEILGELAGLVRTVGKREDRLYCWMA
ncbi:hypothetical protein [Streptomyces sp. AS58]|uniref:hypothetical protein n=1 Tax=Streptomyces sp. AS58 TaxID=1519489 RepID=UPI0006AEBCCF|nr:hypothetical protein [Streptomyces sp. AS58]